MYTTLVVHLMLSILLALTLAHHSDGSPYGWHMSCERFLQRSVEIQMDSNLDRQSKVARAFGLTGEVASFNFGWAVEAKTDESPHCNHWSGYANNHGRLYIEEDSYILLFPQFMASTPASFPIGEPVIKEPMISAFLSEWEY